MSCVFLLWVSWVVVWLIVVLVLSVCCICGSSVWLVLVSVGVCVE